MTSFSGFRDLATPVVSDFYDRFPYPPDSLQNGPPPGCNWRWSVEMVYSKCFGAIGPDLSGNEKIRILDAGCGTGVSTDYLAHLNPGSEILALDISLVALEVAMERARRSGGNEKSKLQFKNVSFVELEQEEHFDYINSIGVLHHLDDPLLGLKALERFLKPGGILHLFLYAAGGRREINRAQKVLKSLDINSEKDSVKLARKFFNDLPKNNRIRTDYEGRWAIECSSDINFADMYLHPRERNFTLSNLTELINSTDLKFLEFSNPKVWNLERFLKGDLLERAKAMPRNLQLQLIEDLDPEISHFELFLGKGFFKQYDWSNDMNLLAAKGKINPYLEESSDERLHDSDMNLIKVGANGLKMIKLIQKFPGTTLGNMPIDWNQAQIASVARDLQEKQVLLLYPL